MRTRLLAGVVAGICMLVVGAAAAPTAYASVHAAGAACSHPKTGCMSGGLGQIAQSKAPSRDVTIRGCKLAAHGLPGLLSMTVYITADPCGWQVRLAVIEWSSGNTAPDPTWRYGKVESRAPSWSKWTGVGIGFFPWALEARPHHWDRWYYIPIGPIGRNSAYTSRTAQGCLVSGHGTPGIISFTVDFTADRCALDERAAVFAGFLTGGTWSFGKIVVGSPAWSRWTNYNVMTMSPWTYQYRLSKHGLWHTVYLGPAPSDVRIVD